MNNLNGMIVGIIVNYICRESFGCSNEDLYVLQIVLFTTVVT